MEQIFIDSISNVRMVMGTIRADVMNIKGQTEDKKLQLEKKAEIILTPAGFSQVLRTFKEVEDKMKEQAKLQQEQAAKSEKENGKDKK